MADFNNTPFPAWPGTRIADEEGMDEPVIGWVQTDNGLAAITLDGQMRMIGDYVVTLADGTEVESPLRGQKAKRTLAQERDEQANTRPGQTSLTPSISLTAKPFATNSWWRYTDGSFDFMFEVPAEQDAPKKTDECQKIKRTEFVEWKKEGIPVELYLDVKEGRVGEEEAEFEPDEDEEEELDEDLI